VLEIDGDQLRYVIEGKGEGRTEVTRPRLKKKSGSPARANQLKALFFKKKKHLFHRLKIFTLNSKE